MAGYAGSSLVALEKGGRGPTSKHLILGLCRALGFSGPDALCEASRHLPPTEGQGQYRSMKKPPRPPAPEPAGLQTHATILADLQTQVASLHAKLDQLLKVWS